MSDVTMIPSAARMAPESNAGSEAPAYRGDVTVYRIVVVILGLVTLAATVGALLCEMGPPHARSRSFSSPSARAQSGPWLACSPRLR